MPKYPIIPSSPNHSSSSSSFYSSSSSDTTDHDGNRKTMEMLHAELIEATSMPPPPPNNHNATMIGSASVEMQTKSHHLMDALSLGEIILDNFRKRLHNSINLNLPPPHNNNIINPNSPNFFTGESSRLNNNNFYYSHHNLNPTVEYPSLQSEVLSSGGNNRNPPISAAVPANANVAKEDDGRMHSLPCKKYGPYTCPRCHDEFTTSQSYAAHVSSHYKIETAAEKKKRLMSRSRVRNRNLRLERVNDNLITFVPVSSSSFYAASHPQDQPPARNTTSIAPLTRPAAHHHQVPPHAPRAAVATAIKDEDEDDQGGVPPPPGFEAYHVRRAKAAKIKSERHI